MTLSFSLITREMTAHYNAVMIAIEAQEEEEVEKNRHSEYHTRRMAIILWKPLKVR